MDNIIQQITDWLKGVLVSGIMNNLTDTFSSVNDQVGQIATDVGQTPSSFLPAVFNMVKNLSESVIMPIAGIILTFIACYELIQLIISYNNLASFETWFIFKWIFKTFVAVELITNTFNITMAVFDVSQSVVMQAGGIIQGSTAIDASTLETMQSTLEAMELGSLLSIFLQSFIVQFLMYVLSAIIFVIINGRMVEIYLMVSLAPIPFATFGNKEQSMMGQNYVRSLFALGFQGFLIMVCVGIYARVSTERKAQLTSLAAQISGLTRYCYRRQYPLKDIYIDVATGEKNTGRPGFTRLIRDCECGAINLVMMKSMSRFGRDAVEVLEMYRRIHATGADVYFQEEDVDSRWENPEQWLAIGAAIAQAENESRSSDIKRGLAMRAADGRSGLYQRKCY